MRLFLFFCTLCTFLTPVWGKTHRTTVLPSALMEHDLDSMQLVPGDANRFVIITGGDRLTYHLFSRDENGFSLKDRKVTPTGSLSRSVVNRVKPISSTHDIYGYYTLNKLYSCTEEEQCTDMGFSLSGHDWNGKLDNLRGNEGIVELFQCEGGRGPVLLSRKEGVMLDDGCGNVSVMTPVFEEESKFVLPPPFSSSQYKHYSAPIYSWDDPDATPELRDEAVSWLGVNKDGKLHTLTLSEGSVSVESSEVNDSDACVFSPGTEYALWFCKKDNGVEARFKDRVTYLPVTPGIQETGDRIDQSLLAGLAVGELSVVSYAGDLVSENDGAETSVPRWYNAVYSHNGLRNSLHIGAEDDVLERGDAYIDPMGFYAVSLYRSESRTYLDVYDRLNIDDSPVLLRGVGASLPSGSEFSVPLWYQDEETAYGEIELELSLYPDWFLLNENEEPYTLSLSPENDDVGETVLPLVLRDNAGNETPYDAVFTVTLGGYRLMVFEPVLFEMLGIDGPAPLDTLIEALNKIPVMEDEVYSFTFSFDNRLEDEVSLVLSGESEGWFFWEESKKTLTLTPSQRDVGEHTISWILTDSLDDSAEPVEVSASFDVVQKEEPPLFISKPEENAKAGEAYVYQVRVDDEETEAGGLIVSVPVKPVWLNWDASTNTLSGTPENSDAGGHRVQVTLKDTSGYIVVQTYTITVTAVNDAKKGGGGSVGFVSCVLLFLVAGFRSARMK